MSQVKTNLYTSQFSITSQHGTSDPPVLYVSEWSVRVPRIYSSTLPRPFSCSSSICVIGRKDGWGWVTNRKKIAMKGLSFMYLTVSWRMNLARAAMMSSVHIANVQWRTVYPDARPADESTALPTCLAGRDISVCITQPMCVYVCVWCNELW